MSMNSFSANKVRSFKMEVGGAMNVYGLKPVVTLPIGFSMDVAALPYKDNVIPAGTPFVYDDLNMVALPHYAFGVQSPVAAAGTTVQVYKGFEGTRAKVGMVLMALPATFDDVTETGTGVTITAIDSSDPTYDVLTLSATLGALAQDDILVEATAAGTSAKIKVLPTATSFADIPSMGDEELQLVDLVHQGNVIYTRRIPPIHPAIRAYMVANQYIVRFWGGR